MRKAASLFLGLVALIILVFASTYSPAGTTISNSLEKNSKVRIEAFFSSPPPLITYLFGEGDKTLEKKIQKLFSLTVPGSHVYAGLYQFKSFLVAQEMEKAKEKKNVTIELVIDSSALSVTYRKATEDLKEKLGKERVHVCRRSGCIGEENSHNKFWLFEEISDPYDPKETIRYVVVQTSANLDASQRWNWNDMVVIYGDKELYDAYLSYWNDLKEEKPSGAYLEGPHGLALSSKTGIRAYFFPSASSDPINEHLRAVSCEGGGFVGVGQSMFKGKAAQETMTLLKWLQTEKHCRVRLIVRRNSESNEYMRVLNTFGIPVCYLETIHSKIVLIDAIQTIEGKRERAYVVFTGSLNRTDKSLHENDEALLRIDNEDVFTQYRKYWGQLSEKSSCGVRLPVFKPGPR